MCGLYLSLRTQSLVDEPIPEPVVVLLLALTKRLEICRVSRVSQ